MTSIAEAAAQALEARRTQEAAYQEELRQLMIDTARQRLADFFYGTTVDVDALEVVHADADQFVTVVTDAAPDPVHLAVSSGSDVYLVELIDGGWTRMSPPLPALADLGAILAKEVVA